MNLDSSRTLIAIAAFAFSGSAASAAAEPDLSFDASAGYRYDSNVSIAATDRNTGEDDRALLLKARADYSHPLGEELSFSLGYGYTSTAYRSFPEFDLAIHHARAGIRYAIAGFDGTLSFDQFAIKVDDDAFLDIRQASPALSRLFGDRLYLRGSYTRAEKAYAGNEKRDAFNDALRADLYVLLDGMQRYLAFGYRLDSEDAATNAFDYDGARAQVAYGQGLEPGPLRLDLKLRFQMENRQYAAAAESTSAPRRDKRYRAGVHASMPLSEHFSMTGEVEFADHRSNIEAADFDEAIFTLAFAAGF